MNLLALTFGGHWVAPRAGGSASGCRGILRNGAKGAKNAI